MSNTIRTFLLFGVTILSGAVSASASTGPPILQPLSVDPPGWAASGGSSSQTFTFSVFLRNVRLSNIVRSQRLDQSGAGRHVRLLYRFCTQRLGGGLYLVGDTGGLTAAPASNSQCGVSLVSSSGSGTTFTLTIAYQFYSAFASPLAARARGDKVVFMAAQDQFGDNSGWKTMGIWRVWNAGSEPGLPDSTSELSLVRLGDNIPVEAKIMWSDTTISIGSPSKIHGFISGATRLATAAMNTITGCK